MALTLEGCGHTGKQQVPRGRRTCRGPWRWGGVAGLGDLPAQESDL